MSTGEPFYIICEDNETSEALVIPHARARAHTHKHTHTYTRTCHTAHHTHTHTHTHMKRSSVSRESIYLCVQDNTRIQWASDDLVYRRYTPAPHALLEHHNSLFCIPNSRLWSVSSFITKQRLHPCLHQPRRDFICVRVCMNRVPLSRWSQQYSAEYKEIAAGLWYLCNDRTCVVPI